MLITVYAAYFIIALAITVIAGRSLRQGMPDDAGQIFTVGFYLFSLGFIFLGIQLGNKPVPVDLAANIEFLAGKLGITVIFIGIVHLIHAVARAILRKDA
jgi:hypothetical protein